MKIAALLHVPFEKLGYLEDWILKGHHSCREFHLFEDPQLPVIDDFDMMVIMGGSMGVYDEYKYPWLHDEKILISQWIRRQKPVLGICLGSQLIAAALGSRVYPGKSSEIGWFPVNFTGRGKLPGVLSGLPEKATVFHWHGDTYDLPANAISLGSSDNTLCQGFLFGRHVLSLQFHCEIKPENISLMLNHAGHELIVGPYVQDAEGLSEGLRYMYENHKLLDVFLNYLIR